MDTHPLSNGEGGTTSDDDRTPRPQVSIGLPVFNGEKYLEETLTSLCAQTYTDFELIISDNASTDRTQQICRTYADNDSRIRYYRNSRNVGASKNFNRVFELSSGVYFKWAAHDDLLEPEFLTKCVEVLDKDPSAALCHSKTVCIDENGKLIDSYECDNEGDSQEPHERFRDQLSFFKPSWKIFGVIRANLLRKTLVMGDYIGADRNLLVDLSLLGRIYEIPECLFFGRIHPQSYSYKFHKENWSFSDYRGRFLWWTEADKNLEIVYPHWKNCREYYRSIRRAPLTWLEQLLCLVEFGKWLIGEGMWVVGYNIYIAFRPRSRLLRKLDAVALKLMTCFREGVLRAK